MMSIYKPSEEVLNDIKHAVKCFTCNGDVNRFSNAKSDICEKICHELGINNPTEMDKFWALSLINKNLTEALESYFEEKYHGNSSEQRSEPCCSQSC